MSETSKESRAWRMALAPLGSFRTQLVWRFFGAAVWMIQMILSAGIINQFSRFDRYEASFHIQTLAALMMVFAGPRLVTLAIFAVTSVLYVWPFMFDRVDQMLGEEFTFVLIIPAVGFLFAFWALLRSGNRAEVWRAGQKILPERIATEVEDSQLRIFRLSALIALFYASFHKFNVDFFDENLSCSKILGDRLLEWWSPPLGEHFLPLGPWEVIVGELLIPALLCLYPLVGIVFTVAFLLPIGSIGPMGFVMSVFAMSFSFLRTQDIEPIKATLRKGWWVVPLIGAALLPVSYSLYEGPRPWLDFFLFQWLGLTILFGVAGAIMAAWQRRAEREESPVTHLVPEGFWASLFPKQRVARVAMVLFAALMLFNGVTPFVGLKYRMSFGMLSNLRADTDRWNHLIIPEAVYLREHDPFVHITKVKHRRGDRAKIKERKFYGKRGLSRGLASTMSLKLRLRRARAYDISPDIVIVYKGEERVYKDVANNKELRAWVRTLPDSKMWQEGLRIGRPQSCVH